jgi:hypothetical protein
MAGLVGFSLSVNRRMSLGLLFISCPREQDLGFSRQTFSVLRQWLRMS